MAWKSIPRTGTKGQSKRGVGNRPADDGLASTDKPRGQNERGNDTCEDAKSLLWMVRLFALTVTRNARFRHPHIFKVHACLFPRFCDTLGTVRQKCEYAPA